MRGNSGIDPDAAEAFARPFTLESEARWNEVMNRILDNFPPAPPFEDTRR